MLALGTKFYSARAGERRVFDWRNLPITLGSSAETLFNMSERSLFTDRNDLRPILPTELMQAPWLSTKGYPAYDPITLAGRFYMHSTWLRPDALINPHSDTLFLRNCSQCLCNLGSIRWPMAVPLCPKCGEPLSLGPAVKVPKQLLAFQARFAALVDKVYSLRPLDLSCNAAEMTAAIWLVAKALGENGKLEHLFRELVKRADLGSWDADQQRAKVSADKIALRHLQQMAAAEYACAEMPGVMQRYRVLRNYSQNLGAASMAINRGLVDISREMGIKLAN